MRLIANPNRIDGCWNCGRTAGFILVVMSLMVPASAQQVQSGVSGGGVNIPQTNLVPIAPPPTAFDPPSSGLGQFDPYATNPNRGFGLSTPSGPPAAGVIPAPAPNTASPNIGIGSGVTMIGPPAGVGQPTGAPSNFGLPNTASPPVIGVPPAANRIEPSPPGGSLFSRIFARPASTPAAQGFGTTLGSPTLNSQPIYGSPPQGGFGGGSLDSSIYGPQGGYAPPPTPSFPNPGFPNTIYPSSTPSTLFPQGLFQEGLYSAETLSAFRLLQGPRLRHGYVSRGKEPAHLGMNDTDTSVIFAFPNFLYMAQPIYVIPSFSLHLWDGPNGIIGADLPSKAYSAFLDLGWESDPNRMFATEFGVRVGAFTDFDTFNSKSVRVRGKGLVSFRLTPTSTIKGGLYYVDRNKVKLIPAAGVLCRPNPFTRIDLFFPRPKYARYCRTVGVRDVWWYLSGDYGGGNWTIKRTDQSSDRVDINDLRAILGLEWGVSDQIRAGRRSGFVEIGYVFAREVDYRFHPLDNYKPDDGIMIRAGIGY